MEIELDLWAEVRRLLPLLEACEEIEPGEVGEDQNGAEPCSPVYRPWAPFSGSSRRAA